MSNAITTEKQVRRFGAHLWAGPERDIIPATGIPNQPSPYELNLGVFEAEPQSKHFCFVICTSTATAGEPVREALPMSLGPYCRAWQTEALLNLGLLNYAATSWRSVPYEQQGERRPTVKQEVSASQRRVNRIFEIQATLGLTVQALATILQISRPALYKWIDIDDEVQPQAGNRERLMAIERVAHEWRVRSSNPLSSVAYEPLADGRTIIEMLTADVLDEGLIVGALDELVGKLQVKPKSLSTKMTEAGYRRRPSTRALSDDE